MIGLARPTLILFVISIPVVCWAIEFGVALTASHVLGLALIAIALIAWLREGRPLIRELATTSLVAYCVVAAITVVRVQLEPNVMVIGESTHTKSIKQLIGLGFGVGVFFAVLHLMRWYGLGRAAVRTHHWTAVAIALLAFAQYGIALVDISSPWAAFEVHNSTLGATRRLSLMYGFPRVSATMIEPSALGTYLLSAWAFWLYAFDRSASPRERRWWHAGSGVLLGTAIIMTGSRLAYASFGALALGAIVLRSNRLVRAGLVAVSVVVGLALTGPTHTRQILASLLPNARVAPTQQSAAARVPAPTGGERPVESAQRVMLAAVRTHDISVKQRTASYVVALAVLGSRPVLGYGWGTSAFAMERYWPAAFGPLPPQRTAAATMMSYYATVASETGLIGLLCIAGFSAGVLGRLWRQWHAGGRLLRSRIYGALAMLASFSIAMLASALVVYQVLLVWLVLAIVLSIDAAADDAVAE